MTTPRTFAGCKGFTLLEVIISMMLISAISLTVYSAIVTSRHQGKNSELRAAVSAEARSISIELKNYVTDPSVQNGHPEDLCAPPCAPTGKGQCWALQANACVHDVTSALPEKLRTDAGATITYTVIPTPYKVNKVVMNIHYND